MQVPIAFQPTVMPSALEARLNSLEGLLGHAAQGTVGMVHHHKGTRMFRVSSVPRPGRVVFSVLIRPSEPAWGSRHPYRKRCFRAESVTQLMSEEYVHSPIQVSLVFFLILRHTPLDMLTSLADLR